MGGSLEVGGKVHMVGQICRGKGEILRKAGKIVDRGGSGKSIEKWGKL